MYWLVSGPDSQAWSPPVPHLTKAGVPSGVLTSVFVQDQNAQRKKGSIFTSFKILFKRALGEHLQFSPTLLWIFTFEIVLMIASTTHCKLIKSKGPPLLQARGPGTWGWKTASAHQLSSGDTRRGSSDCDKVEGFVPWPSQWGGIAVLCFWAIWELGLSIFRCHFPPGKSKIFCEISPNLKVGSPLKIKEHTVWAKENTGGLNSVCRLRAALL